MSQTNKRPPSLEGVAHIFFAPGTNGQLGFTPYGDIAFAFDSVLISYFEMFVFVYGFRCVQRILQTVPGVKQVSWRAAWPSVVPFSYRAAPFFAYWLCFYLSCSFFLPLPVSIFVDYRARL